MKILGFGFFLSKPKPPVQLSFSLKYDSSKKLIIIIDVMIFKRFSLQRKNPELCYICE